MLRMDSHEIQLIDANGANKEWSVLSEEIRNANYDVVIFRFTPTTFDWDTKVASVSKSSHPYALTVGITCFTLHTVSTAVLSRSPSMDIYIGEEYETVVPSLIAAISNGKNLYLCP